MSVFECGRVPQPTLSQDQRPVLYSETHNIWTSNLLPMDSYFIGSSLLGNATRDIAARRSKQEKVAIAANCLLSRTESISHGLQSARLRTKSLVEKSIWDGIQHPRKLEEIRRLKSQYSWWPAEKQEDLKSKILFGRWGARRATAHTSLNKCSHGGIFTSLVLLKNMGYCRL